MEEKVQNITCKTWLLAAHTVALPMINDHSSESPESTHF